ncbi:hypothetical protein D3C72_1726940 [compost metagenome]
MLFDVAEEHIRIQHPNVQAPRCGHCGQGLVAVAASGIEAQHKQLVRLAHIQRAPGTGGGAAHFDVADALAKGGLGVHFIAQAAGVGVRAGGTTRAVRRLQAVFEHALDLLARDVQAEQHVAKRKHLNHLCRRHCALQRNAHAAAALQRDVGAAVFLVGHVQVGLGHQLLDVATAQADAAFGVAGRAGAAVVDRPHTTGHAARA